jgi:hypothetical protein
MEDIAGSREFSAMSDSMILIEDMGNSQYMLKQTKNRYSSKCYSINFSVSGNDEKISITYEGEVRDKYKLKYQLIEEALFRWYNVTKIKEFRTRDVLEDLEVQGFKRTNILTALGTMVKNGKIKQKGKGEYEWC